MRRGVRAVEGARLESVCRGNLTAGSNPALSAMPSRKRLTILSPLRFPLGSASAIYEPKPMDDKNIRCTIGFSFFVPFCVQFPCV